MNAHLEQRLDLLGHLAGAGEEEPELVGVCGHDALGGDVHAGVGHGARGRVHEGDLVRHRAPLLGRPGEVDMVHLGRDNLHQGMVSIMRKVEFLKINIDNAFRKPVQQLSFSAKRGILFSGGDNLFQ